MTTPTNVEWINGQFIATSSHNGRPGRIVVSRNSARWTTARDTVRKSNADDVIRVFNAAITARTAKQRKDLGTLATLLFRTTWTERPDIVQALPPSPEYVSPLTVPVKSKPFRW